MTKGEQGVYDIMLRAFLGLESEFRVIKLENRVISDIYSRLKLDEPWLFYVTGFSMRIAPGADHMTVIPKYMFKKDKVLMHRQSLQSRVKKLIRPMEGLDRDGKEAAIHDFICSSVKYDKLKKDYSHEVIGPLTQGVGVCEGIAKTVKLLCDEVGIECVVALCENDPSRGIEYRHTWNVLNLGGKWYHLDATFDNTLQKYGSKRFDYYNINDKVIFRDHCPLVYPVPECRDDSMFYYRKKGLSLTKYEDVAKKTAKAAKSKKEHCFTFHWRGGYLSRKTVGELGPIIAESAEKYGRGVKITFNFATSVIHTVFTDLKAENTGIQAENPDEERERPMEPEE